MPNETRSNGMLLGAVIGGTMGIIATLLLAPKSGAKMREDLSTKYQSICDKTKEIASTVGDTTKDIVESVKDEASSLAEHAKESNQNIKDSFTSSADGIKEKLGSTDK